MTDRTMLEKALDKAFLAHPYGFNGPVRVGEWVLGPAFAVKAPEYREVEWPKVYAETDPLLEQKLAGIVEVRGLHPLELQSSGHRQVTREETNKHGAKETKGGGKCTHRAYRGKDVGTRVTWELAFPLVTLGKKLKVAEYKSDGKSYAVYGYTKDKQLVAVFAPRISPGCVVEWEAEEKAA